MKMTKIPMIHCCCTPDGTALGTMVKIAVTFVDILDLVKIVSVNVAVVARDRGSDGRAR